MTAFYMNVQLNTGHNPGAMASVLPRPGGRVRGRI